MPRRKSLRKVKRNSQYRLANGGAISYRALKRRLLFYGIRGLPRLHSEPDLKYPGYRCAESGGLKLKRMNLFALILTERLKGVFPAEFEVLPGAVSGLAPGR